MTEYESSIYVSRWYVMDPEFDDLIFGSELREGMVVLLEDMSMRGDPERMDIAGEYGKYERHRCFETSRWCTVTRLKVRPRPECGSPLVQFIAEYGDGTKAGRTYDASYAWIVKKDSLAAAPVPSSPEPQP